MACHKEPPFTAEQVAWIDQRIAGAPVRTNAERIAAVAEHISFRRRLEQDGGRDA
jgi:hypothetical protein